MNFSRRFSASFGSWCVQLVYDPRARPENEINCASTDFEATSGAGRALWPAFAAIFVAVAAACYALAHFVALPMASRILGLVLCVAIVISWGARCGAPTLRRTCRAARWPLALMLAVCALSLRWSEGFSELLRGHPNMQAAVFCGFITLLSVLLIGARSGGRLVPVAAPLVPALALLGLLCLVAVDGLTQACFLLFCAAALYLLCYDRFLRRAAPDLSSGVSNISPGRRVNRGDAPAWALQSVLVSSVWFALFLGGGALLFWPLQALLPRVEAPRWNRGVGESGGRKLDYSGGAPVMELRGGTHALSDRVLLRVTTMRGVSTGLWRGRVYQDYERSLWSERQGIVADAANPSEPFRLIRPRDLGQNRASVPQIAPGAGRIERISEIVVPLGGVPDVVYSSGLPLQCEAQPQFFDMHDPQRTGDLTRSQSPYLVQSFETQPNPRVLDETPGFDPKTKSKIAPELRENLIRNLQLPPENSTRAVLQNVVHQIKTGALPVGTPSEKARAVADHLRRHYFYSLQAPAVPPTSDATAFFLSDARGGACDMFASSAALLLREMGVPARVATGFLDPQSPESSRKDKNGQTVKILRERDAHAWVEYYVPTYGWLSFDPTQNTREAPPTLGGRLAELFQLSRLDFPPVLWTLPLVGLTLLSAGLLWHRRDANARNLENERQFIEAAYAAALRLLRRRVPHSPHLAPGEYETRVLNSDVPAAAKQEFAALTHLYRAARYGAVAGADHADVAACLARLQSALKGGQRV